MSIECCTPLVWFLSPRECNIQLTLISKIRHGKVTGISVNSREDEDVDLSPLAQCHDLIRLTVDFPLTQNDLEILSKLPHFAELELLTPCQPDAHSRLEQLNLRRIKLCRPDIELLRTLVKMKRLTSLSLSSLQDVPESLIKEIVGLPSLSDLGIRESVIDDGFMNALKQSRSLRRLWLDGCDLHRSSGIAVLRETDIEFLGLQHVQFPLGSTIAFSDPKYWRRLQRVEISSATAPHVQTRSGITVAEF